MPDLASDNVWAVALSVAAIVAVFRFKLGMMPTLAASSAAGLLLFALGAI